MEGIFFMSAYEGMALDLPAGKQIQRKNENQVKMIRRQRRIATGVLIAVAGAAIFWSTRASLLEAPELGRQFRAEQTKEAGETPKDTALEGAELAGAFQVPGERAADLLVLVNKEHALPADYQVTLHWLRNGSCAVAEDMYGALQDMLTDGSDAGMEFVVASGYRDAAYQQELLEEDIQAAMEREGLTWQEAYEKETQETMPPGHSEHETGLAVDLVALDYQILNEQQEATKENVWLRAHCSEYGFIQRYPQGKEEITGIDYEAWHFRYVGKEAAQEITGRGITLEEYLEEK